ncbi:MAG TPA: PqqD family protein [Thermoanaerobaculia bacterium]
MRFSLPSERQSIFRHSENVVCRNVGGEAILVPIRNNVGNLDFVYTLSPVAARIWSLLDGERNVNAVIEAILEEYETDRETAVADVEELLVDLAGAELIIAKGE